jgi:hypothetical protein
MVSTGTPCKRMTLVVTLLIGLLAVAGCSSDAPAKVRVTYGILSGRLEVGGGPAPGLGGPIRGRVTFVGPNGKATSVTVGDDGRYRVRVPTGRYRVTGRSPLLNDGGLPCMAANAFTVSTGRTVSINVACGIR